MANIRKPKYQLRVNNPDAITDIDVLETIQSQYAASPRILALLVAKAAIAEPGKDLMLFYDGIFNPQTAQGVGLDIWGRIVGIGRRLWMENTDIFGFAFQDLENFDQAPFWIKSMATGEYSLPDEDFRLLVFHKAMANISDSPIAAINRLLSELFYSHGSNACSAIETGPMSIRVVFDFYLSRYERALFAQYGLLNRPAGVDLSWYQYNSAEMLGFAGQDLQNFDNGVFTPYAYQTFFPESVFGFSGQRLQNFGRGGFIPSVEAS